MATKLTTPANDAPKAPVNASSTNIDYPYYKYIKPPSSLGMDTKGKNIGKNFNGLMAYVNLLVFGKSKASVTGKPLGNRFFVKTYSKCKDIKTTELVDRYIYIDNVPSGNLRLDFEISDDVQPSNNPDETGKQTQGPSVNTGFTGLVPAILEDITKINPITLFKDLEDDTYPPCHNVTLDTIDSSNVLGSETRYVSDKDLKWVDPCFFTDNINVATKIKCKHAHKHESFENKHGSLYTVSDKLVCVFCSVYISIVIYIIFIYIL